MCTRSSKMFITISIKILLGKRIVPWTIVDLLTEDRTFSAVFSEVKAGKHDSIPVCDELKRATIKQVLVGHTIDKLVVVSENQSVFTICQAFGKVVEFRVELLEEQNLYLIPTKNAFDVMAMAQRRAQLGDNGVPKKIPESTSKDRLFNDLIQLMKDINVKWSDPNSFVVPFLKSLLKYFGISMAIIIQLLNALLQFQVYSQLSQATIVRKSTSTEKGHERICDLQS